MERRVRGNPHARCEVGEKMEIASKSYLSLLTDEQLQMFKSDFGLVADYFVQKRRDKSYLPSAKAIRHVDGFLKLMAVMGNDIQFNELETQEGRTYSMCEVVQSFVDKGALEQAKAVAARMLAAGKFSLEEIAELSGLPLEEVRELR